MDNKYNHIKELGFGGAVAQSRSIQGLVRVMGLFEKKYPGGCSVALKQLTSEGVEMDFSASPFAEKEGLNDFLDWLNLTDRFMQLESVLAWANEKGIDVELTKELMDEAKSILQVLYPEATLKESKGDEIE